MRLGLTRQVGALRRPGNAQRGLVMLARAWNM